MTQNIQSPLVFSRLKNHAVPFDLIKLDMYLPQLKEALQQARESIDAIKKADGPIHFTNTIESLECASEGVDIISSIFFNQLGAMSTPELQSLSKEIAPMLSQFSSDVLLDDVLFSRVKTVFENRQKEKLSIEQNQLLEKTYDNFRRNGALLDPEQKKQLRELDERLSVLSPQFSENVLKATNNYYLHLTNEEEIDGLPGLAVDAAARTAKDRNLTGWIFTLQMPSYIPFMQFAKHRPSREKMYRANATKCVGGPFDNRKLIIEILKLREKRAHILGYDNHASFVLEKRMAETAENVFRFLTKLEKASFAAAKKDVQEVADYAASQGAEMPLMPWDFTYWSERLKETKYKLNQEELRPYFQLENVIEGAFEHARRLYGIQFSQVKDYPVYHPDVKVYEVYTEKNHEFVGLFYTDFFPRESKNGGAWMTTYFDQGLMSGEVHRPHVAIVCNFTPSSQTSPSLLTFDEVSTLFHEFGHALHGLLSQCRYRSLSGTSVYWDFVELPSQIMENWILEKESLELFAKHYKTGVTLPEVLISRIKSAERFQAGYMCLRQLQFALLDMKWHTTEASTIDDVMSFEEKLIAHLRVLPKVEGASTSCAFSHIFAGGYSAGYYSYKWAEVLDADAFEYFKEKGIFNPLVASQFRDQILARGGSEPPMVLFKRFRGREPDPDALLRRDGLI